MLNIHKNKKGAATMVEVIVTSIIFTIAAVGIYSSVSLLRPESADTRDKVDALYRGKQLLESLQGGLSPSNWVNGTLNEGNHQLIDGDYIFDWTVSPVVINGTTSPDVRKITLNITY